MYNIIIWKSKYQYLKRCNLPQLRQHAASTGRTLYMTHECYLNTFLVGVMGSKFDPRNTNVTPVLGALPHHTSLDALKKKLTK